MNINSFWFACPIKRLPRIFLYENVDRDFFLFRPRAKVISQSTLTFLSHRSRLGHLSAEVNRMVNHALRQGLWLFIYLYKIFTSINSVFWFDYRGKVASWIWPAAEFFDLKSISLGTFSRYISRDGPNYQRGRDFDQLSVGCAPNGHWFASWFGLRW